MMHRRELLLVGAGALAAKATATTLACAADPADPKADPKTDAKAGETKMDEHEGHEGHEGHKAAAAGASADMNLVNTVGDCVAAGAACLSHCIRLLSSGDTSMGDCAKAVTDMLAICRASESLAASASKHLEGIAPLCIAACSDCAEACKPHAGHHAECKNCLAQCNATVAAMKKMLG